MAKQKYALAIKTWIWITIAALAAAANGQQLPSPANTVVYINDHIAPTAAQQLIGRGISLPSQLSSAPFTDRDGNELVWRQVRNNTDARGGKHVFYRQYFISIGGPPEVELFNSEVALHYNKSGVLWSIAGHQFTSVALSNRVAFGPADAVTRVLTRLLSHSTFRPETLQAASDQLSSRIANTRLRLVNFGDSFRYAWFTFARNEQGVEYRVVMDAQTEEILALGELHLRSNCQPTTPWQVVSATGWPVRPDLFNIGVRRSLRANYAPDRPSPFIYEGYDSTGTHTTITQETGTQEFRCDPSPDIRAYTLVPVTNNAGVVYRDVGEWRGNVTGDALYNTQLTLAAFSTLGRNGWNGVTVMRMSSSSLRLALPAPITHTSAW